MHKPGIKFIVVLTAVFAGFGLGYALVTLKWFPQQYFASWPIIPVLFYLMGWIFFLVVRAHEHHDKTMRLMLMLRVLRFLALLAALVVFLWGLHVPKLGFVIGFLSCYFTFLVLETWGFHLFGLATPKHRFHV